ncbi:MAG: hypothetical protein GF388_11210, partial [Candidatus Aegiribacteria sp.]|nr:hypothetical protein [Candidatus Aegiribacteria sp.]MBD3295564.1 hypothetical protein [Candidatus Fermentibacteria bacterium]
MLIPLALYLAGLLILFIASGLRSCLPELTLSEGRDPSERRRVAFFHLGIIWLMKFFGAAVSGGGSVMLGGELSSLLGIPWWASVVILILAGFFLSIILPSMLARKNALRLLKVLRIPYLILSYPFRLPALLFFGTGSEENPDT